MPDCWLITHQEIGALLCSQCSPSPEIKYVNCYKIRRAKIWRYHSKHLIDPHQRSQQNTDNRSMHFQLLYICKSLFSWVSKLVFPTAYYYYYQLLGVYSCVGPNYGSKFGKLWETQPIKFISFSAPIVRGVHDDVDIINRFIWQFVYLYTNIPILCKCWCKKKLIFWNLCNK